MTTKVQISQAALVVIVCAGSLGFSPSQAQVLTDNEGVRYEKVSTAGLDPDHVADMKIIVSRVNKAAEEVCGPMPSVLQAPVEARIVKTCMSTAEQDALGFVQHAANKPGRAGQILAEINRKP